jgi:crotonobetainyl-CoA:carnitine CoA-transferase CaiB-like acyl-CoA transferase
MGLSDSKRRHAPDLGEDSDAILEGLNFSSEEIAQFKQSGALG